MFKDSRGLWLLGGLALALFAVVVTIAFVGGQDQEKSQNATPSSTAKATTDAARPAASDHTSRVDSVSVATELVGPGNALGPDRYEAAPDGTAKVIYRWRSTGGQGEINGDDCRVISSVVGSGGFAYNDTGRTCSGRASGEMTLAAPGKYTITVTVIGPGGQSQGSGTNTVEVVASTPPRL
ncbi:hypothetical protein [Rhodococcus chondri]|uniref:Uncharacterized protein n=1 Tax=Rhodococcus chondri TaxID=3065941 RepID=A0ABU7JLM4_9NOCA|nr:hypothetical protein [Rhodococcus sp. CC-R104]MEE2030943.1 hypothetical protein [Rhodococcus sp. CC-R104]